jgi:hypothetical protein
LKVIFFDKDKFISKTLFEAQKIEKEFFSISQETRSQMKDYFDNERNYLDD